MANPVNDSCQGCVLSGQPHDICGRSATTVNPILKPCDNCGSNDWTHATPSGSKGALTKVVTDDPSGGLAFVPTSGTPVDMWFCDACGLIRLFGIRG